MKILLDTHILLWALSNDTKLPEKARKLIENEENEIYYSIDQGKAHLRFSWSEA